MKDRLIPMLSLLALLTGVNAKAAEEVQEEPKKEEEQKESDKEEVHENRFFSDMLFNREEPAKEHEKPPEKDDKEKERDMEEVNENTDFQASIFDFLTKLLSKGVDQSKAVQIASEMGKQLPEAERAKAQTIIEEIAKTLRAKKEIK